ncbi:hypothetical protein RRG08_048599 [Elysia crispata]|uniref:Uncharacterized protein n=1 Tax=Elysia crispata TaxID=231223 RepID=A0AAE1AD87_9GAST|nr:hypothetical protein RRG08_048599 [Elysia crispata]
MVHETPTLVPSTLWVVSQSPRSNINHKNTQTSHFPPVSELSVMLVHNRPGPAKLGHWTHVSSLIDGNSGPHFVRLTPTSIVK